MGDLITGIVMIGAGAAGMITAGVAYHRLPEYTAAVNRLHKCSDLHLHAALTRCVADIAECARRGDLKGMRRVRKRMHPILHVLRERCKAAKRKAAHVGA